VTSIYVELTNVLAEGPALPEARLGVRNRGKPAPHQE